MAVSPNLPAPLTQTYTYDGANRLKTAQESGSWSRVYDYDAYGHRWVESANHTLTFATPTASSQFNAGKWGQFPINLADGSSGVFLASA